MEWNVKMQNSYIVLNSVGYEVRLSSFLSNEITIVWLVFIYIFWTLLDELPQDTQESLEVHYEMFLTWNYYYEGKG